MHGGAGKPVQTRHVVFVDMAQYEEFGGVELGANVVRDDRGIEGPESIGASNEHLIPIGIFSVFLAEEN
jgi:hypothetical protein